MTQRNRISDEELDTLLARSRSVPPVPNVVRARAVARARAAIATGAPYKSRPLVIGARGRGLRMAVAASLAMLICAAGAVAAFRSGIFNRPDPEPEPAPITRASTPISATRSEPEPPPIVAPLPKPAPRLARATRPLTARESYAAERSLLQRAQVAYAGQDFSAALMLVAEHGRRFPNGRLAEEREALRVQSLAGAGRANEARRAVAAFAARFPRSVLLPRLQESVAAPR
jgi:hypothetical protein